MVAVLLVGLVGSVSAQQPAPAQKKDTLNLEQIPKKVMETLKAKFPKAEIRIWSQEEEDSVVIYDIEFTQEDRKFEADIRVDGSIHNWEQEIQLKDLPDTVKKAVETRYPNFVPKEIMLISVVDNGKDILEGYEILLDTADKKEIEVMVSPDGQILEDSSRDEKQ
jgi:hypothetical protein